MGCSSMLLIACDYALWYYCAKLFIAVTFHVLSIYYFVHRIEYNKHSQPGM